jgi:DNA-binding winged helix-turn-helix (wHTH) protein
MLPLGLPEPLDVRPRPVRFGIFEVDLASGELRKQGVKIKLQEQPFQALVALIERPCEVLTREDLQKRLWPVGTNVDFDRGLNKAINRLREALGDDADNPRFIETLPQRGYRFLAQVEATLTAPPLPETAQSPTGVPVMKRRGLLAIAGGLNRHANSFFGISPSATLPADRIHRCAAARKRVGQPGAGVLFRWDDG